MPTGALRPTSISCCRPESLTPSCAAARAISLRLKLRRRISRCFALRAVNGEPRGRRFGVTKRPSPTSAQPRRRRNVVRQPPLPSKLFEMAAKLAAAAVRSIGAAEKSTSAQARSSSSSRERAPASSASTTSRSRSSRCSMYSRSLAWGLAPPARGPDRSRRRSKASNRASDSRYPASEPDPGAMKTLPLPSTVSPVKSTRPEEQAYAVNRMPRGG